MTEKKASTSYPIHQLLADRWSPYAFQNRPVSETDLRPLFEEVYIDTDAMKTALTPAYQPSSRQREVH
jgi:hypothetical protein